jgi:electron transfer flavoprotein beta subunit
VNIVAILKMVPDVVEEFEVAADGKSLDIEFLRLIVNERDEHALEQALILKELLGGSVTALALDAPDIDDVLFTALAKGADRAVRVTGVEEGLTTRSAASILAQTLPNVPDLLPAELILTGCQAIDDIDAQAPALLARRLQLPYLGLVSGVEVDASTNTAKVAKEFAGGVRGEFELTLPAVLGIQAAEKPPRYVPVAKVRAAMKEGEIEEVTAPVASEAALIDIIEMNVPEVAGRAEMLEGDADEIAARLCDVLVERGLL